MKNKFKIAVVVALMGYVGVAGATTYTLGDLINGNLTIRDGDKVFSGFGVTTTGDEATQLKAEALGLQVSASMANGVYYLDFAGLLALNNANGTTTLNGDVTLKYTVTALAPNLITMIDQQYTPNGTPGSGQIVIGETAVNPVTGVNASSTLTLVPRDIIDPAPEAGDLLTVSPGQSYLNITKDILITAFPGTITIGLSDVEQSFHQGVPDGGLTVALLGFVLVGVEGLRRKLSK